MTNDANKSTTTNLSHAIAALAVLGILVATFVLATEIILILFLGVVFGIFLTKLSSLLSARTPVNYRGALAIIVIALLFIGVAGTAVFFVRLDQQIEDASGKIDEGIEELQQLIKTYPALQSIVNSTPFLSDALGVEKSNSDSDSDSDSSKPSLSTDSIPEPVAKAAQTIGQFFKTTFGLVVNSLLIFFVGLFLAVSPDTYRDGIVTLVPIPRRDRATEVLDATSETLWRWLIGRFGSMLATGGGAFLILLLLGVPMAGTLGVLTALLTFVPNIGAAVALLLAILFSLPQGLTVVCIVIVGYVVLQLVESYVITPLIQQKAISLPPAMLISFQAIMGVLFGFIGAAVASPLLAASKTMVQMLYVEDYLGDDQGSVS